MHTDLFGECRRVGANTEVGFCCVAVDVLQTVTVSVHDQTRGIIEQNADAVITQLVTYEREKYISIWTIFLESMQVALITQSYKLNLCT